LANAPMEKEADAAMIIARTVFHLVLSSERLGR